MTDEKALRERLDAMVKASMPKNTEVHEWDDWHKATTTVALDLLRRLEERETPCEWTDACDDDIWTASCGMVDWCFIEGGPKENRVKFCPGCGHPVVVKSESQDATNDTAARQEGRKP